jgi:hypothetical protein
VGQGGTVVDLPRMNRTGLNRLALNWNVKPRPGESYASLRSRVRDRMMHMPGTSNQEALCRALSVALGAEQVSIAERSSTLVVADCWLSWWRLWLWQRRPVALVEAQARVVQDSLVRVGATLRVELRWVGRTRWYGRVLSRVGL